jgi:hypothetical protein
MVRYGTVWWMASRTHLFAYPPLLAAVDAAVDAAADMLAAKVILTLPLPLLDQYCS